MTTCFISVIIPTLNRCQIVKTAILSAQEQFWPADQYEIIVVDNGSTDGTSADVKGLVHDSKTPMRLISEPRLGLHNARHAGARAAKGDILIFTDDDAVFDPDCFRAYAEAFDKYPTMAAASGPVRPTWEVPPPAWLVDYMGRAKIFGILSLMEPYHVFQLSHTGFLFGVNMAIRRNVLFKVGGFNPDSFGDIWLGDGETGLNRKLWQHQMLIGYVPQALVHHRILPERMSVKYFCRRMANEGACDMYDLFHKGVPHWVRLFKLIAGIALRNGMCWLAAMRVKGRTDRHAIDVQIRAAHSISQIKYIFRLIRDKEFRKLVLKQNWLLDA